MYTIYTVRYGDNLELIAEVCNTTVDELKRINNIDLSNGVSMGDQIIVPNNEREVLKTYVIITGDTLYDIARRNNVDVNTILLLNGLNKDDYLYPGQEIVIPTKNNNIYITKDGDTLNSILDDNNIMIEKLMEKNKNIYLLPDQMMILNN